MPVASGLLLSEPVAALVGVVAIIAAITAILRGIDVRLALMLAALVMGAVAGDVGAIVRAFLDTFTKEQYLLPIGSAMGFAYVLRQTRCDQHLVQLLLTPLRHVRPLLIPGVVLAGFVVNIPVISQTSTAVCLGAVAVPLLRAAGFSPLTTGATVLLGASVGGELLNPGAPELNTVAVAIGNGATSQQCVAAVFPLVLVQLCVSTVAFWLLTLWAERRTAPDEPPESTPQLTERVNVLKALVPVVPLAILFATGPPFNLIEVPRAWLVDGPNFDDPKIITSFNNRLIGAAMLIGVVAAVLTTPREVPGSMRSFFDGAGYAFANIISLIVVAVCFGKGVEKIGLAGYLGGVIASAPGLLLPAAGGLPMAFGVVSGSGMASTQSLYGPFFLGPARWLHIDPILVGAVVSLGAAAGRTMSPVAAVTLMCGTLTGVGPFVLVKRVAGPLLLGVAAMVAAASLR